MVFVVLCVGILAFLCDHASGTVTMVGAQTAFTATEQCVENESTLMFERPGEKIQPVAHYSSGRWVPARGYEDRTSPGRSVILNNTNFNDQGLYELKCGTEKELPVQLDVVQPYEVSVFEGGQATLPLHFSTLRWAGGLVRCERSGELVFQADISKKNATFGPAFVGKASLPSDWWKTGNFSLSVGQVKQEHAGLFIFYPINKHGAKEKPAAVNMAVSKRNPDPDTGPGNLTRSPDPDTSIIMWGIVGGMVCGALMVLGGLLLWSKLKRSKGRRDGEELQESASAAQRLNCNDHVSQV